MTILRENVCFVVKSHRFTLIDRSRSIVFPIITEMGLLATCNLCHYIRPVCFYVYAICAHLLFLLPKHYFTMGFMFLSVCTLDYRYSVLLLALKIDNIIHWNAISLSVSLIRFIEYKQIHLTAESSTYNDIGLVCFFSGIIVNKHVCA